MNDNVLSVSDFIARVNDAMSESWDETCGVEGEVSGYRVSRGTWVSFDLKDGDTLVNVFLPVWNLRVPVGDGMRVRVYGRPRVYPKYGKFSFSAEIIVPAGEGELKKALQMLRVRLEQEGLFDPSRKRELPRFPGRVAFIGSKESAAYGDFIRILGERWGGVTVDVYHVLVQGERAPSEIVAALRAAQGGGYDVIVLTRGGGSLEELMAFNDEAVARAVHASAVPTLVAVGHERDVTLAEEAADVRASTPTDCARRLVPDRRDVLYELDVLIGTVDRSMSGRLEEKDAVLSRAVSAPLHWIRAHAVHVDHAASRSYDAFATWFGSFQNRLAVCTRIVSSFDPKAVLKRGYAIVRDAKGVGIGSVAALSINQKISLTLADGDAEGTITKT